MLIDPTFDNGTILKTIHSRIRDDVRSRLEDFRRLLERGDEKEIFAELAFCILTPQCKAETCWMTVERLRERDLLAGGEAPEIAAALKKSVRFHNNKAKCIIAARGRLPELMALLKEKTPPPVLREWLVKNIPGIGYKEAGHFLRNIGLGDDLAILDRHILRSLVEQGVIPEIPSTLTKKRYLEIEEKMRALAADLGIPLSHLDFVFWYKVKGDIFK